MKTRHLLYITLTRLTYAGIGLFIATAVLAEDIEVFSTNENPDPPNVLFVLDTSGSMKVAVPGSGGKTRMEVLQESLNQVLSQDYNALNVGIMDFGRDRAGGIDFPISDINGDANDIDPDIPEGTSVRDVLKSILENYSPNGKTPIGPALYNASSYFLGSKISAYGYYGKPNKWDVATGKYTNGNPQSASPASYEGGTWFRKLLSSAHTHASTCNENKPASDSESCLNSKYISYYCSIQAGKPEKPLYWKMKKTTCDSTGTECSSSWSSKSAEKPVAPDDGNSYTIQSWGPYAATEDKEICKGNALSYDSGFDTRPTYKSPIIGQCQSNYVVLLGDGEPTESDSRKISYRIEDMIGGNDQSDCENLDHFGNPIDRHGRCVPDLTKFMSEMDLAPNLVGDQTVTTYTVGFALGGDAKAQQFLKLLSDNQHGKGKYFDAGSPGELSAVFQSIIDEVVDEDRNFVGPTVSTARNNRLATSEYVYQASFVPSKSPSWKGEITRYKIGKLGYDGNSRIDLSKTLSNTRSVYTYTGNIPFNSDIDLDQNDHRVFEGNEELGLALLGLNDGDEALRTNILRWARGIDSNDRDEDSDTNEAHGHMGDSLHSKPALISYESDQDILFAATNDGYLHAFNVSEDITPYEIFSFIPQALLKNLRTVYNNNATDKKSYGLDGDITVWQSDEDVTLYIGMRRGGRNYYALDVSTPEKPKLKWIIEGGIDDTPFEELGQSWSAPQLTKIKIDEEEKMVLIIGGGYDTNQDSTNIRQDDAMGRAVFIVDAETGKLLWSAGPDSSHDLVLSEMKNSIPSNIRAIDFNGDGLTDRLYFGDTGGRIWRIDLDSNDLISSSGYQLADLNNGIANGNRRFYYAPSVAISRKGKLKIAIGSGYRAHPLSKGVQDRLYVFEDTNAAQGAPSTTPSIITDASLTAISSISGDTKTASWYLNLAQNEKALSESIILNNNVTFSTYRPTFGGGGDICNANGAQTQAYVLGLAKGKAAFSSPLNNRAMQLKTTNIPSSSYLIFNAPIDTSGADEEDNSAPESADMYIGKQKISQIDHLNERMYWRKDR